MIFAKRNYKILSGTNISLYAENNNEMSFYIFNNSTTKNTIHISNTLNVTTNNTQYPYNQVSKINENFLCVCFDDNMSVIRETE